MNMRQEVIDGQELYFLSEREWSEVFESGKFREKFLSKRLIAKIKDIELPLSIKNNDLHITLGFFGANSEVFSYPLLKVKEGFQRVYLEGVKCQNCQWVGRVGNPLVSEIYWGISKDKQSSLLMAKAREDFTEVLCPKCSSPFDRFFIWVESQE